MYLDLLGYRYWYQQHRQDYNRHLCYTLNWHYSANRIICYRCARSFVARLIYYYFHEGSVNTDLRTQHVGDRGEEERC
jgi:hypothetical protein